MATRATAARSVPGLEAAKTRSSISDAERSDFQPSIRLAGGTMAGGEKRVFSPFFLAARLVRGATGLSRSGGEGS